MSFLSQFWKGKKDEEDLQDTEAALDVDVYEEEGLLMSTNVRKGASAEDAMADQTKDLGPLAAPKGEAAAVDSEEAAQGQAEIDDLLEPAEVEEATSDASEAPESAAPAADPLEAAAGEQSGPIAEAAEEEGGLEESSDGPDDDPLAAFRSTAVEDEIGDLTKEIENIPVEELVADLREVWSMLSASPPGADNGEG